MLYQGKTVVVLGASSEGGTGWLTAKTFAREGARVVVAARSMAGVERLASEIGGMAFQCDAGVEDQVAALADFAIAQFGTIDVAINAAGVPVPSTVEHLDRAVLQSSTEINFFGHLYFIKHMTRGMKEGGAIISIASLSASAVIPGNVIYGCAKAAVVAAIRYAAAEYGARGITINAISPGIIDTPMAVSLTSNAPVLAAFLKETPMGKITGPQEIADAAVWLARSRSATGLSLIIDGGMHLRRPPYPDELPSDAFDNL